MRQALNAWPEIIFVDTTYNLLTKKLIVLLMCVQDSMGLTHVAGVGLLLNEEADTLKSLFENFKALNEDATKKIKCIMTDKDLNERKVLKEVFPYVDLYLCEFHALKAFSRAITMASMSITSKERDMALDILDKLAKCNSEEQYNCLYIQFCKTVPKTVVVYYDKNWHTIREEWTRYGMSKNNLGNYTNNPVECTNASIKRVIPRHSPLKPFSHAFFRWYKRRNEAIKFQLSENVCKHPIGGYTEGSTEALYEQMLTPKYFKLVMIQYARRKPLTLMEVNETLQCCWIRCGYAMLKVGVDKCECTDYTSTELPRRHIFAVRECFKLPLFDKNLCPLRWTNAYNLQNQPVLKSTPLMDKPRQTTRYSMHEIPARKAESFPTRLKMMRELTGSIAYCASIATNDLFRSRYEKLQKIDSLLRQNKEFDVVERIVAPDLTSLSINECEESGRESESDKTNDDSLSSVIMPTPIKIPGRPRGITKSHTYTPKK